MGRKGGEEREGRRICGLFWFLYMRIDGCEVSDVCFSMAE